MALTVSSDPLGAACNSYADLEEMTEYLTNQVEEATAESWNDLSESDKARYLVNATRTLDSQVQWIGDRYSDEQKLKWPRLNAVVDGFLLDELTFPPAVVAATCEMALWLMANSGAPTTTESTAYDSIKVGPIAISMRANSGLPTQKVVPDIVAMLLSDYGQVIGVPQPGSNMVQNVRLERA